MIPPDLTVGRSKFPAEPALAKKEIKKAHSISVRAVASVAYCII